MSQEGVEALTSMGTSQNIIHPTIISFDDKYCHNKKNKIKNLFEFYTLEDYYDIISNNILYQTHNYKHLFTNCTHILPTYPLINNLNLLILSIYIYLVTCLRGIHI